MYWILVDHRFNYKILGGTEGRSRIVTIEDWRENELEVSKQKICMFIKHWCSYLVLHKLDLPPPLHPHYTTPKSNPTLALNHKNL
jgi:hypothetical protein